MKFITEQANMAYGEIVSSSNQIAGKLMEQVGDACKSIDIGQRTMLLFAAFSKVADIKVACSESAIRTASDIDARWVSVQSQLAMFAKEIGE